MRHLKDFFKWLVYRKGYKRTNINQIEYLNLTDKESRAARGKILKRVPTIEQIIFVVNSIPDDSEINRRNKALIAFTLLTGMRDGAIASLKLKHIKLDQELVEQKGDEVNTKFGKTIYTYFFPVGDDIKKIVIDWIEFLYKDKRFNDDDPLIPRTKMINDKNCELRIDGIEPYHWKSANQIRKVFREAFENAGMEYFTPHSFRSTLVRLAEKICKTPEAFKAWSQNLGHEQVLTTFISYGQISEYRQGEIIGKLLNKDDQDDDEFAKKVAAYVAGEISKK